MHSAILPDKKLMVIARPGYDSRFGVIHSRFHELWSLGMCTWHGVGNDPRYTPTTTFETFPFPEGVLTVPSPDARFSGIAQAACRLKVATPVELAGILLELAGTSPESRDLQVSRPTGAGG